MLRIRGRNRAWSDRNPVVLGYIGTAAVLALVLVVVNVDKLPFLNGGRTYHAVFAEAGGLSHGDDVVYAGLKVGTVSSVRLSGDRVVVTFKVSDGGVHLGNRTSAQISTVTILGRKAIDLDPAGVGSLPHGEIPLERTTSPYDITDALSQLTTTAGAIDVSSLSTALDTIGSTFHDTPPELSAALSGLGKVADTIASRDDALRELLGHTSSLTGVLAARNQQITALLTDGASLFAELNRRHDAIVALLSDATAVATQFRGLVADQQGKLGPALSRLDEVVRLLNRNKTNLETALQRVGPYATALGESVGSGPFFDAYLGNLTVPGELPIFPHGLLPTAK